MEKGLRKLQYKDAPHMLEWMHDRNVVEYMSADFAEKKITDCDKFIKESQNDDINLNLAIVNADDVYMGTVSLKHIDHALKIAEFAITVRLCAMGQGYSVYGMREILRIGLEELGLQTIYWCVSRDNKRAVRFYEKNGYRRAETVPDILKSGYTAEQLAGFIWYAFAG